MGRKPAATVTGTALADLLGVTLRRVQQLAAEGMPSRTENGERRFVARECVQWVRERDVEAARKAATPADADEAKERALKMKADRELAELRLAERRRELVEVAAVLKSDERLFGVLRARVTGGRGKWAPRMLGLGTMAEATRVYDEWAADTLAALEQGADAIEDDDNEQEAA